MQYTQFSLKRKRGQQENPNNTYTVKAQLSEKRRHGQFWTNKLF